MEARPQITVPQDVLAHYWYNAKMRNSTITRERAEAGIDRLAEEYRITMGV
jgi:hypothetical protein